MIQRRFFVSAICRVSKVGDLDTHFRFTLVDLRNNGAQFLHNVVAFGGIRTLRVCWFCR